MFPYWGFALILLRFPNCCRIDTNYHEFTQKKQDKMIKSNGPFRPARQAVRAGLLYSIKRRQYQRASLLTYVNNDVY